MKKFRNQALPSNVTNFRMLFNAVAMNFTISKVFKILKVFVFYVIGQLVNSFERLGFTTSDCKNIKLHIVTIF